MKDKKYYWIKLKTDFFDRDEIDFMLSQENGCEYIVLYQMLCMKSANNGGILGTKIDEVIIPYDINKIVRDTKYFNYDTVAVALELYKRLGLVYEEDNKILKIADYNNIVGSETKWAEKKRIYREKKMLGQTKDNVLEDIDIDIELDKDIDINNNKEEEIIKEEENVFDYYQQNIGQLTPYQYERLDNYIKLYGNDRIKEAINIACDNNVRTFKYFESCVKNGKYTFKNKNEKSKPEWLDKENKDEMMSEEELKELESDFNDIFGK